MLENRRVVVRAEIVVTMVFWIVRIVGVHIAGAVDMAPFDMSAVSSPANDSAMSVRATGSRCTMGNGFAAGRGDGLWNRTDLFRSRPGEDGLRCHSRQAWILFWNRGHFRDSGRRRNRSRRGDRNESINPSDLRRQDWTGGICHGDRDREIAQQTACNPETQIQHATLIS